MLSTFIEAPISKLCTTMTIFSVSLKLPRGMFDTCRVVLGYLNMQDLNRGDYDGADSSRIEHFIQSRNLSMA